MGMMFVREKAGKTKRKPGWQKAQQEYAEWQSKIAAMSSGIQRPKKLLKVKPVLVVEPTSTPTKYVVGSGTKPVPRPEIRYRDNPELLERELAARAIKHNAVPAYNKAGDSYVTQEELVNMLRTNKRRS
jgi:hypothetical protein